MPYIIVNDAVKPWCYYTGKGFLIGSDTTDDPKEAKVFPTLSTSTYPLHKRSDLYAIGWRVVPTE